MSNQSTSPLISDQSILGYVLKERIGAGGYGEVWSAEAPGGLMKAVKFIYGFHDENRAQRELKALDRIKHIRHPFLLSLERIDVVDGRMVVITELADMCLKTRHGQCRDEGIEGIPRQELLVYMREAADALDYLAETCSLAHLDIKPENLLVLGNHVKVADFGLVKNIQDMNQSLMDGLTPAYAAPELFDGKPCGASDQYSLAIVFQEMLTSTRPFSGTTAAQLASQHLHSRPNLNSLPRGDQAVIARSLSKNPDKRYADCKTLIEELTKRRSRVRKSSAQSIPLESVNTELPTNAVDPQQARPDITMTISESFIPAVKYESELDKLDPLELDLTESTLRPTLIIGVGKTASQTMCKFRRRLNNRYGAAENIPSIRILCLDTDRKSLFKATHGDDHESLKNHEILTIPLRKPEEYRNDPDLDVSWIGRRWIYNIPKSQLTESLRPLGRLAFVDHHETIYTRINDELDKLARPEALATSAETTGLMPSDLTPQVIIVSSISGGLGSGMVLDLAYSVRVCMGELGLSDEHVFGLFLHSTSRAAGGDSRLSIVNSYAFLNELYHYNLNGYPGADHCEIPAFDEQTPALDGSYFVHLGDDLQPEEYDSAIDSVAEYLYLSTATRCTGFFDECRLGEDVDPASLRAMGINSIGRGKNSISEQPARELVKQLLNKWLNYTSSDNHEKTDLPAFDVQRQAQRMLNEACVSKDQLSAEISQLVRSQLGDDPLVELMNLVDSSVQSIENSNRMHGLNFVARLMDERIGISGGMRLETTNHQHTLCDFLDRRSSRFFDQTQNTLTASLLGLINNPNSRLGGSKRVGSSINQQLHSISTEIEMELTELEKKLAACFGQFDRSLNSKTGGEGGLDQGRKVITEYVDGRLREVILKMTQRLISKLTAKVTSACNSIGNHQKTLELVKNQIYLPLQVSELDEESKQTRTIRDALIQKLTDQVPLYCPKLEQAVDKKMLPQRGGLLKVLLEGDRELTHLIGDINREASTFVCQAAEEMRIDSLLRESEFEAKDIAIWLKRLVETAIPITNPCGGTSRLLLATPEKGPVTSIVGFIQNQYDHEANVIPSTCGDLVVCFEIDNIPMENVAMSILQMQPDCAELIDRLHCRTDVEWTSLTPLC